MQCFATSPDGGCSTDEGWNNSVACGGASCTAQCANDCVINNGCSETGGTDPVVGTCPTECRQGNACGAGYDSASGCSGSGVSGGCTINQTCCQATGKHEAFASAFTRLANQNLGEINPEKWVVFMFYSHPPLGERIEKARRWKAV